MAAEDDVPTPLSLIMHRLEFLFSLQLTCGVGALALSVPSIVASGRSESSQDFVTLSSIIFPRLAFDLLARYDSFKTAVGLGTEPARTQFLVFGFMVNPGFNAKFGLQYSVGIDGSLVGVSQAIDRTNTGPGLADNQFLLNLQLAF